MTARPGRVDAPELLYALEGKEAKLVAIVGPGVYAYGEQRPLGRIRAYTSAGLQPFAGRGLPSEFHLVGHVHIDDAGKVTKVEGFNGAEGERWAKGAAEKVKAAAALAEGAIILPLAPLRGCPHTGVR